MKKLLIAITLCLFTTPAFAEETLAPVTPDKTVTTVDQVEVKKTVSKTVETETVYTLASIDRQIAQKQTAIAKTQARITHLQGDIAAFEKDITDLQALRAKVETEAKKVELADEPTPEDLEGGK